MVYCLVMGRGGAGEKVDTRFTRHEGRAAGGAVLLCTLVQGPWRLGLYG